MGPTGSVAWEWAMKIQEVILRAMAKRITWWQAVEILGIGERQMRRWRWSVRSHWPANSISQPWIMIGF